MKLNVGCGNIPLEGYLNIDKFYYPGCGDKFLNEKLAKEFKGEWKYGDAETLEGLPNDHFDEVILVHVVEHLSMGAGNQAIKNAVRVLKPNGFIEIEVPDLEVACALLPIAHIRKEQPNHFWFRVMGLLYGDTGVQGEGQYHLCGYTKEYLKFRMEEHGLKNIKEIPVGFGHGRPEPEYDFRLRGFK